MKTIDGYNHAEAYCLMWYACICGHRERIWNARDGVTPYGTDCPSCGDSSLRHADFDKDIRAPKHVLRRGQRYWRDGTREEGLDIIRNRIEQFRKQGHHIAPGDASKLLAGAMDQKAEWAPGWPTIDIECLF